MILDYPSGRSTHGVLNDALWGFAIAFSLSAPVAKRRNAALLGSRLRSDIDHIGI